MLVVSFSGCLTSTLIAQAGGLGNVLLGGRCSFKVPRQRTLSTPRSPTSQPQLPPYLLQLVTMCRAVVSEPNLARIL